ncbi:hypothetical protein FG379_003593 [Cryptosporidium bovis]|uniref:uncharacterized protein n=1 Tax=Cryptosporidium bovis TaxID=310047 RepID=UPI00351A700D|nr:hypothetical protein FG379_003593 [Cryptosporidium bovis]
MENFDEQGFNQLNNEMIFQENEPVLSENIDSTSFNSHQIELNANTGDVDIKLNFGESFGDTSVDIGDHSENTLTYIKTYENSINDLSILGQLSFDLNEEEIGDVNIVNESSQDNENSSRVHGNRPTAPPTLTTTVEPIETLDASESATTDDTSIPGSSDLAPTRNNNEGTETEPGTVDGTTSTTVHLGLIAGAVLGGIGGLAGFGVLAGLGAEYKKKTKREIYKSEIGWRVGGSYFGESGPNTPVNAEVSLQLSVTLQQTMAPVIVPIIQAVAPEPSAVTPGVVVAHLGQES